jgi:ERCC4-type nuclease
MEPGCIYVDRRVGSRELEDLLGKGRGSKHPGHGIKTHLVELDSADFAFTCGHTHPNPFCDGDYGCRIGVERKTISDLISSLLSGRMVGHQIPQMLTDYTCAWILVEGLWQPGAQGEVQVWRGHGWGTAHGKLNYMALSSWLVRFDVMGGGRLKRWRTASTTETCAFLASLFRWWQKEWEQHQVAVVEKMGAPQQAMMWRPSQMEKVAMSLVGVGAKTAKKVCKGFGSVHEMMLATPKQWQAAGLGKKLSYQVYQALRGR